MMELADLQGSNHEHQPTEINEQTMTQRGRQLFGRRNTLMGGEMGWTKVRKDRMTGTEKGTAEMKRKDNTEAFRVENFTHRSPFWKPPAGPYTHTNTDGRNICLNK